MATNNATNTGNPVTVAQGGTGAATLTGLLNGNGTGAITATAITQYNILSGGASNAPNSIAPSSTSGVALISQGSSSQPIFGTVAIAGGGTNATSFTTSNGIVTYNGTSFVTQGAILDSNNILTNTSQPFLYAKVGSTVTDFTGDGTTANIVYDTIVGQQGSNYNNTTGVYTCPTAGVYLCSATIGWNNISSSHTRGQINILCSGSDPVDTQIEASPAACQSSANVFTQQGCIITLMAANGTIKVQGFVANGTKTVGILGEDFGEYSNFYIVKLF